MNKTRNAAHISLVISLFLALCMIVLFGIPFFKVPSLFDTASLNLSSDLTYGYRSLLSSAADEIFSEAEIDQAFQVLQKRVEALPYEDLSLERGENGTFYLYSPKKISGTLSQLCELLCAKGTITYTDSTGAQIIPESAVSYAKSGFGLISADATAGSFYLEFFLQEDFRAAFSEATAKLAARENEEDRVLHIKLDGSDILQATVSERMTQESFLIGGYFEDATLPNLYAAFVNAGELPFEMKVSDSGRVDPTLSENAYPAFWGILLFLVFCLALSVFFRVPLLGWAASAFLLLQLFSTAFLYQISDFRISPFSFLGIAIGLGLSFAMLNILNHAVRQEALAGKSLSAAKKSALRNRRGFYFAFHAVWLLVSGIPLVLSGVLPSAVSDLLTPLFFSAAFSLVFLYIDMVYWLNLFVSMQVSAEQLLKNHSKHS